MQGVNSWGAKEPLLEVGPDNFCYAVSVEVEVEACHCREMGTLSRKELPSLNPLFSAQKHHCTHATLQGHSAPVIALAADFASMQAISASTDNTLRIWDLR